MKKLKESKKRWRKKIEGDQYVSDPETEDEAPPLTVQNETEDHNKSKNDTEPVMAVSVHNHRRKRYSDLKSVHEKKQEMRANESLMRTFRKSERFEF